MNIFEAISKLPHALTAARDLALNTKALHDSPRFKALMESDPNVKKQAEAISRDVRTLEETFR